MTTSKASLYSTARAVIGCAFFPAGAIVAVKYIHRDANGVNYYLCAVAKSHLYSAHLHQNVAYPEHHLTDFVL